MVDTTKEYGKLLVKYCKDDDFISLIEQCTIHELEEREKFFEVNKRYPEKRDGLMKLKSDLNNMKHLLIRKAKEVK